ncbi:hypothetical protein ACFWPA_10300 [Rhodococcus sp. NPDC058505]|uniref:hypothetical protein n=1 Tax=unclassified Rhodococcus (in: high G+C Gram-positive bacteria) TaxID=192944 RepID=UPI00365524AF
MFTAAALVSSPPLLLPELAGAAAAETADLRAASIAVAGELGRLAAVWTVIGVGDTDTEVAAGVRGTFRGYGADVRVASGAAGEHGVADPTLPLATLTAGWLRGRAAPDAEFDTVVLSADTPPASCVDFGRRLRARLDADPRPRGVLVVADGAATLTAKAPGSFDDRAPAAQADLDRALRSGDVDHLAALDPVICTGLGIAGRPAWQALAALFGGPPARCRTDYQGAPYGVGYHVGMWLP